MTPSSSVNVMWPTSYHRWVIRGSNSPYWNGCAAARRGHPGQRLAASGMTCGKAQHLTPVTGTFSCGKACAVAAGGTARFW
ncbi:hypothetical protein [Streptomyces sp. NPDC059479]|uniref:hypothetical protein n=1 Tax=Streptomyces sp. NPDC059479 TaxID=3346848 RepID=UPI0036A62C18